MKKDTIMGIAEGILVSALTYVAVRVIPTLFKKKEKPVECEAEVVESNETEE